jgi:hypothetical protein
MNRAVGHGSVEVFFVVVERNLDCSEVSLQALDVLLLFHDEKLSFGSKFGLFLLKFDLSVSGFLFAFTVVFLFFQVESFLISLGDWLGFKGGNYS